MRTIALGGSDLQAPVIAAGCMRISGLDEKAAAEHLENALAEGVNFFDHADIYGGGRCEEIFAKAVRDTKTPREKLVLQSKCGIKPGEYDFSKDYILQSADGILRRLNTDYLDILLLHRPDALMNPEEVAEAFERLREAGKVRRFGVSNQNPMQMQLLQKALPQKLLIDQLQLSITNCGMIRAGLNVNMQNDEGINRDSDVLNYCRLNDITVQTWSPFQYGMFAGTFLDNDDFPELNRKLAELAEKYGVTKGTITAAWILRHPAKMQVVIGTTIPSEFHDACKAADLTLTHKEWYEIYLSAGNKLP